MVRSSIFKNNTTQAVRLPKSVALPSTIGTVDVSVLGNARIIVPSGGGWRHWAEHGTSVTDDFFAERAQPQPQERAAL